MAMSKWHKSNNSNSNSPQWGFDHRAQPVDWFVRYTWAIRAIFAYLCHPISKISIDFWDPLTVQWRPLEKMQPFEVSKTGTSTDWRDLKFSTSRKVQEVRPWPGQWLLRQLCLGQATWKMSELLNCIRCSWCSCMGQNVTLAPIYMKYHEMMCKKPGQVFARTQQPNSTPLGPHTALQSRPFRSFNRVQEVRQYFFTRQSFCLEVSVWRP